MHYITTETAVGLFFGQNFPMANNTCFKGKSFEKGIAEPIDCAIMKSKVKDSQSKTHWEAM